jgi:membrane protein
MLRCQYCGRAIHGKAADLEAHSHRAHPEHAGIASEEQEGEARKERYSPWKLGGLSAGQLAKRVWGSLNDDDVLGRAAELGYYGFFSLFPALIVGTSILGMMAGPGTKLHAMLLSFMGQALPGAAYQMVQGVLDETAASSSGGKITFGILASLWTASSAMAAVQDTLNGVYDVPEGRPLRKSRGIALLLTIASGILLVLAMAAILYGGVLVDYVGSGLGLSEAVRWIWKIGEWPIALFFLSLIFAIVYYYAPDVEQKHWEWLTPGSVLGIAMWIVASFGFRIYLHYFNSYSATYGSLGAVIILLTWFYVTGLMLLLGAEVNAEIEHAAARRGVPDAKRKGQKVAQKDQPSVA